VAAARRSLSPRRNLPRPTLYFDLASPYTYYAAERADRMFAGLDWRPAAADALRCGGFADRAALAVVTRRAAALELPMVWPMGPPVHLRGAMRVAALACEYGLGAQFVVAASRLLFCGAFDLEDPEVLAVAASAAGLDLGDMLRAAGDEGRDAPIFDAGDALVAAGASRLPVLRVGQTLFCGEERLEEALVAVRAAPA